MKKILKCSKELELNNNKEWFKNNKAFRDDALKEFEGLIENLMHSIGKFDSSILDNVPHKLTFKQVRDTRYNGDNTPYNPCFRAHIARCGKQPIPVGYFISIRAKNRSFIGGGLFTDIFKDATTMLRDYIVENGEELYSILNDEKFKSYFFLKGVKLKKVPSGYDAQNKWAEYLKYKSMYIEYPCSDGQLLDKYFVQNAAEIYSIMKPFNDFINKALENFVMPERPRD